MRAASLRRQRTALVRFWSGSPDQRKAAVSGGRRDGRNAATLAESGAPLRRFLFLSPLLALALAAFERSPLPAPIGPKNGGTCPCPASGLPATKSSSVK